MSDIIYEDINEKNLQIFKELTANQEVIRLLKSTVYGTTGPRYLHTNQDIKATKLINPSFFRLVKNQETIGVYCIVSRKITVNENLIDAFYGRYLAIKESESGKKYGQLLKRESVKYIEKHTSEPHIIYAYVEGNNQRSFQIFNNNNFSSFAQLEAFLFSRFNPKMDSRFQQSSKSELSKINENLEAFYSNHQFKTLENIGYEDNCFVLKENGRIIAGIQANAITWRIVDMPGLMGKIMMNIIPRLPYLKRLVNPKNHQFLAIEGIYYENEREDLIFVVLESALAYFGLNSAMMQVDLNDPLFKILDASNKMGLMNKLKKKVITHVMMKANGFELTNDKNLPLYISAFDYT